MASSVRAGSLAYGAAVLALIFLAALDLQNSYAYFYDYTPRPRFALGLAVWTFATFGPLILSIGCWHLVKHLRLKWAVHLLFLPCAIAIFRGGGDLLLYTSGQRFWNMPLEMFLMLAGLLLSLTLVVHFGALLVELVRLFRRRPYVG